MILSRQGDHERRVFLMAQKQSSLGILFSEHQKRNHVYKTDKSSPGTLLRVHQETTQKQRSLSLSTIYNTVNSVELHTHCVVLSPQRSAQCEVTTTRNNKQLHNNQKYAVYNMIVSLHNSGHIRNCRSLFMTDGLHSEQFLSVTEAQLIFSEVQ